MKFPPKIIAKIASEEFISQCTDKKLIGLGEIENVLREHSRHIASLDTYENLNDYFTRYRGLSLDDWVNSL